MALKDTLGRIREENRQAQEFEEQKPQIRAERSEAIRQVMTTLERALSEFVASGDLLVKRAPITVSDDGVGPYPGEMLSITVAARPSVSIQVKPSNEAHIGRREVVEITRLGGTHAQKGQLFRMQDPSTNELYWAIQAPGVQAPTVPPPLRQNRVAHPQQNQARAFVPLTAENFLAAVDHLIK